MRLTPNVVILRKHIQCGRSNMIVWFMFTIYGLQVDGYTGQVWISVHLVTSDGQPHYHSIHGPGSTKVPCKEMKLQGVPAVQVMVAPDTDMTAM